MQGKDFLHIANDIRKQEVDYQLLGIEKEASQAQIKTAYLNLAKVHHPDVNPSSAELFSRINEAYETLKNEKSRALYDKTGLGHD